jgi:hypothetical protein
VKLNVCYVTKLKKPARPGLFDLAQGSALVRSPGFPAKPTTSAPKTAIGDSIFAATST